MIGATWARRTQAVSNATAFCRRLPEEDQGAALALLGNVAARRRQPLRSDGGSASSCATSSQPRWMLTAQLGGSRAAGITGAIRGGVLRGAG
jgi:hypothetical protein